MSIVLNIKSKKSRIAELQNVVDHLQDNFDEVVKADIDKYRSDQIGGLNYGYLVKEFGEDMVLQQFKNDVKQKLATAQAQIKQLQQ